jgi:hypothetical protein
VIVLVVGGEVVVDVWVSDVVDGDDVLVEVVLVELGLEVSVEVVDEVKADKVDVVGLELVKVDNVVL